MSSAILEAENVLSAAERLAGEQQAKERAEYRKAVRNDGKGLTGPGLLKLCRDAGKSLDDFRADCEKIQQRLAWSKLASELPEIAKRLRELESEQAERKAENEKLLCQVMAKDKAMADERTRLIQRQVYATNAEAKLRETCDDPETKARENELTAEGGKLYKEHAELTAYLARVPNAADAIQHKRRLVEIEQTQSAIQAELRGLTQAKLIP